MPNQSAILEASSGNGIAFRNWRSQLMVVKRAAKIRSIKDNATATGRSIRLSKRGPAATYADQLRKTRIQPVAALTARKRVIG